MRAVIIFKLSMALFFCMGAVSAESKVLKHELEHATCEEENNKGKLEYYLVFASKGVYDFWATWTRSGDKIPKIFMCTKCSNDELQVGQFGDVGNYKTLNMAKLATHKTTLELKFKGNYSSAGGNAASWTEYWVTLNDDNQTDKFVVDCGHPDIRHKNKEPKK